MKESDKLCLECVAAFAARSRQLTNPDFVEATATLAIAFNDMACEVRESMERDASARIKADQL